MEQKSSNPSKSFFINESLPSMHENVKLENESADFNEMNFQKPILVKQNSLEVRKKLVCL